MEMEEVGGEEDMAERLQMEMEEEGGEEDMAEELQMETEEVGGEEDVAEELHVLVLKIGVLDLRLFSFMRFNLLLDFLSFCCKSFSSFSSSLLLLVLSRISSANRSQSL